MRNANLRAVDEQQSAIPQDVLDALNRFVSDLRFGSIEIVVHEGRITQIERREKLRFSSCASRGD